MADRSPLELAAEAEAFLAAEAGPRPKPDPTMLGVVSDGRLGKLVDLGVLYERHNAAIDLLRDLAAAVRRLVSHRLLLRERDPDGDPDAG